MNMWNSTLAVEVESHGVRSTFGPFPGMPAAMQFVSEHVWDTDRYRHHYVALNDPTDAATHLNRRHPNDTNEEAGLFDAPPRKRREPLEAALRDAICREHGDPGDGPHGDGLYAHLDEHRPWRVELKAEECWEGECDHDKHQDGTCATPPRHELWCRACTPVYAGGGEHDGTPYDECRADWPCTSVLTLCASFNVSLTGKGLR